MPGNRILFAHSSVAVVCSVVASFALMTTSACSQHAAPTAPVVEQRQPPAASRGSLFERLGGLPAISAVVDDFLVNVLGDDRIADRFAADATDPAAAKHLRQMLIDQICVVAGGPCEYKGKPMPEAHKDMNITKDEFTWLVEDLIKSLDEHGVKDPEKTELLTALAGMEGDIVGR
jgi:hemoglobin